MNGIGNREANEVTLMINPCPRAHRRYRQAHQLEMSEHQYLELAFNLPVGQMFGGAEVTTSGVVDYHVEMPGLRNSAVESSGD